MKTDWKKCDNFTCDLVAFITLKNKTYDFQVNVCPKHYEELKHQYGWEVADINKLLEENKNKSIYKG